MFVTKKRSYLSFNAIVLTCLFAFKAQAGIASFSLDLIPSDPDISANEIVVNYDFNSMSGIGALTASGSAVQLSNDGTSSNVVSPTDSMGFGEFALSASINTTSNTASGDLTISGIINENGFLFSSGTLLTGVLTQIGGADNILNFLFDVTGGDAADLFGDTAGVILSSSGYLSFASFNDNFSSQSALADTFAVNVPVPHALSLFLLGLVIISLRSKLRA
jgi:hypothetical protein